MTTDYSSPGLLALADDAEGRCRREVCLLPARVAKVVTPAVRKRCGLTLTPTVILVVSVIVSAIVRRDLGARGCIHIEPARPRQKVEEVAVALREIALGDWLEMTGGSSAFQAHARTTGFFPSGPVGTWP